MNEFNKTEGPEGHYAVKHTVKNTVKYTVKLQSRTTY